MSKHTLGPWDVRKVDSAPSFRGIFGICANGSGNSIREEEEANARLIAAAPEMLEALKLARNSLRPFTLKPIGAPGSEARAKQDAEIEAYNTICAVIAKAEGRE